MTGNTSRRESSDETPGSGFGITDAYFILFRRKWLIIACSLTGLLTAALIWLYYPRVYESEAKLLVRYVVEDRSSEAVRADPSVRRTTETRPESVINSEAEILGSFDIAQEAAKAVGPAKILGVPKAGDSVTDAAGVVRGNLTIDPQKGGNVITLRYRHPEAEIPPLVLQQIISAYERKHFAIHRNAGAFDEFLTQLIDGLKMQLKATEEELKKARRPLAGVASVQDAKKAYVEQVNKTRQDIFATEAELAQRRAIWAELRKQAPTTNTPAAKGPVAASQSKVDEYRNVRLQLEFFEQRDRELSRDFTGEYPLVKANRAKLEDVRRIKERMELENPSLVYVPASSTSVDGRIVPDSMAAAAEIIALEVKYSILTNQMAQMRSDLKKVEDVETEINELERRKALEETQYISFSKTMEQAKFEQMLGSSKVANIRTVESPLPPYRNAGKLNQMVLMAICGGVGGGLALAFLLELVVDRSLKRPKEIEEVLGAPLFLTVPQLRIPDEQRPHSNGRPALPPTGAAPVSSDGPAAAAVPAVRNRSVLDPYCEALRDRLISHFEIRQMTHKPKMVGVTGCLPGAGVTSIAAGLASSLSETGDGNVLLVEMNGENGAARAFYRGKAVCGLDELLENDNKKNGLLQDNLCVVSGLDETGRPQAVMSRKFSHLVPKLKASDYDYIIFDLPPVSQTSVTGRVSRFMDMLFLVVESEQTDRDLAKRALHLLEDSKAHATVVLNKYKSRVPQWLHREFQ